MDSNFNIPYVMGDLSMLCLNISDIAIITVKNADYRCIIANINPFMHNVVKWPNML